jgi:5-methyltetrahydrofolate--homocysteine methyltransferase
MINVAKEMQHRGMSLPLLIGGATTSAKHTAVKVTPEYAGTVVHVADASLAVGVLGKLLGPDHDPFVEANAAKQAGIREKFEAQQRRRKLLSWDEAKKRRAKLRFDESTVPTPAFTGLRAVEVPLAELAELIDWTPFFHAWQLKGSYPKILDSDKYGEKARELLDEGKAMLAELIEKKALTARGVYGFFPAHAEGEDLVIQSPDDPSRELARIPMLRQQDELATCYSLVDFVAPAGSKVQDHVGAFAVTAGLGIDAIVKAYEDAHDDFNAIMVKAIADRLAEAFAEYLHRQARSDWGYGGSEDLSNEELIAEKFRGIRPAFGYPACPDHGPKAALFELLDATSKTGIELTDSMAMVPTASVSGLYFAHPRARYFSIARLGDDQLEDYRARGAVPVGLSHL